MCENLLRADSILGRFPDDRKLTTNVSFNFRLGVAEWREAVKVAQNFVQLMSHLAGRHGPQI